MTWEVPTGHLLTGCLLILNIANSPNAAHAEKSIDGSRFEYQGCFQTPMEIEIADIAYYPDGDPSGSSDGYSGSLFLVNSGVGGNPHQVTEISIPSPAIVTSSIDCPSAFALRPLTTFGCNLDPMTNDSITGGIAYYNDVGGVGKKLYWTIYEYYNVEATNHDSAGRMDLDFTNCEGAWGMTGKGGGKDAYHSMQWEDYIFPIHDKAWADEHLDGRYLLFGKHRESGNRGSATGIQLYAAAPWNDGDPIPNNGNMNGQVVLQYAGSWGLPGAHLFPAMFGDIEYRPTDRYSGGAWVRVGTEDAIVITGRKGLGEDWYGNGGSGCNSYQGYHDDPYQNRWWFYDPTDLECSIARTCKPWKPVPYAVYDPAGETFQDDCFNDIEWQGGAAFDERSDVFFFAETDWVGGKGYVAVIHVYRVTSNDPDESS